MQERRSDIFKKNKETNFERKQYKNFILERQQIWYGNNN